MRFLISFLLFLPLYLAAVDGFPDGEAPLLENSQEQPQRQVRPRQQSDTGMKLEKGESLYMSVIGEGVAPQSTISPAQAKALAKRAAMVDAYRVLAEKIEGVQIEGRDTIKNMIVNDTNVRTRVQAMIKRAEIVQTTFNDGLCEVEVEIRLHYGDFQ